MQNTRLRDAQASVPSRIPAPNTIGTMPISDQLLVRCSSMNAKDEIRIATIAAWMVAAKNTAAINPQNHCVPENELTRKLSARIFFQDFGGPPPRTHQM